VPLSVTSAVSICNSALIKLGADRINALNEDNKRARLCNEQYPKLRDDLLRSHPWNFATTRVALSESTYVPSYEYEKSFLIPSDNLRVLSTDLNLSPSIGEIPWDIETNPLTSERVLVTNASTVNIKYIKLVSEEKFDKRFAETLAFMLAADLAYPITQSTTLAKLAERRLVSHLRDTRTFNGQESNLKRVEADDWLVARL